MSWRNSSRVAAALTVLCLGGFGGMCAGWAQTATATLTGMITDPTGSVVTGAKIQITGQATGIARETVTDSDGRFLMPSLPPGSYELKATANGFKTAVRARIQLQVQQEARLDVELEVGATSDQVTVEATTPLVQAENPTLGQVVNNKLIVELPLNGRNFLQLAQLSPGVATGVSHAVQQPGARGASSNISVNGLRPELNNYLLDGVTNVDGNWNLLVVSPSIDTLQEFKIQTNSYSAEFGRSPGAQINAVTKAGTNEFHGALYEFLRNEKLDAKNFFDRPTTKIPPYKQNQFGGGIGGPIWLPRLYKGTNRSFFFFNYEGLRIRQAQTLVSTVPTDAVRNGDFSGTSVVIYDPATARVVNGQTVRDPFPGNRIPTARISAAGKGLLDYYPRPNLPGAVANYVDNETNRLDSDQYTARVDHQVSSRDNFYARYIFTDQVNFVPGRFPGLGSNNIARPQNLALNHTHTFSPSLLNEFRFGFVRAVSSRLAENVAAGNDVTGNLGIRGFSTQPREFGLPVMVMNSITQTGDVDPFAQVNNTFQWIDNVVLTRGNHALKFGAEIRRFQFNIFALRLRASLNFDGRYTNNPATRTGGSDVADLLLGLPNRADRTVGDVQSYFRRTSSGFYFQDDWKLRRNLTVNIGLRYELVTPFTEKYDKLITTAYTPQGITMVRAGVGDPYEGFSPNIRLHPSIKYVRDGRFGGRAVTKFDRNNFAPRLGIAWNPGGSDRWVIRAGAGVFFAEDFANVVNDMTSNPPQGIRQAPVGDAVTPTLSMLDPFSLSSSALITIPRLFSLDPNLVLPYVTQYSLTITRQLRSDMVLEFGYAGNQGHKISAFQIQNIAPAAPGPVQSRRVPSPELGTVTPMAPLVNSNYHGLRVSLEKRAAGGLSFISAYTWSKAIDDGVSRASTGQNDFAQREDRRDLERALSDYDNRHIFRLGLNYNLPKVSWHPVANALFNGWQAGTIVSMNSGNPFTIFAVGNTNTGVGGLRANAVPGQDWELPRSQRSVERYFNTAAFSRPADFTFGNLGRNTVIGPGFVGIDASLARDFRFSESHRLQFRAEFFNLPNRPNFGRPGNSVGNATYGRITSVRDPRQIQFGLKYVF